MNLNIKNTFIAILHHLNTFDHNVDSRNAPLKKAKNNELVSKRR